MSSAIVVDAVGAGLQAVVGFAESGLQTASKLVRLRLLITLCPTNGQPYVSSSKHAPTLVAGQVYKFWFPFTDH